MSERPPHDWEVHLGNRHVLGRGLERRLLGDVFHHCMSMSWGRLLGLFLVYAFVVKDRKSTRLNSSH